MRTLLVTGGSGFIGSNFIHYMLRKYPHYSIVNLDNLTYAGNQANLRDVENSENYDFIHGDIQNVTVVIDTIRQWQCSAIINFAAESHVDRSIQSAQAFMETNIMGAHSIIEAARATSLSRLIHVSTDEVYGSIDKGSFSEVDNLLPSSPYSASKASADLICHAYIKTYDMPIIVTRSSNNFGPYQYPEKLIPLLITNALANKALPIYGDGKNVRDWLFVEDNCAAIDMALHVGEPGEVYNIGGGNELTNIEIARLILKQLDKPESLLTFVDDRLGHDRRYSINCDKIRALGWSPEQNFLAGLEKTISWYQENQTWWEPLLERTAT